MSGMQKGMHASLMSMDSSQVILCSTYWLEEESRVCGSSIQSRRYRLVYACFHFEANLMEDPSNKATAGKIQNVATKKLPRMIASRVDTLELLGAVCFTVTCQKGQFYDNAISISKREF